MIDTFLSPSLYPFSLALGVFAGLLALELVMSLLGATLLGLGEGADIDLDGPDMGVIDAPEIPDMGDLDLTDFDPDVPEVSTVSSGGALHALGLGRVPFMIWFAALLVGFGLTGQALQMAATAVLGAAAPLWLAVPIAGIAGFSFARASSGLLSRLLPRTETEALSERSFGRRRGIITQGTARRGAPAEVRVTDRYGNAHYLRAEPLRDSEEITSGSEVLVLRHRSGGGYRLVSLSA